MSTPVLYDLARLDPNGLALDDLRSPATRRSWAELADRANRIGHWLRDDLGLSPDDHVALLLDNRAEAIELLLGSILAGVWLTPINWHLTADEVAYIVRDSGARLLFTDERHEATARAASKGTSARVVSIGGNAGSAFEAAIASASDAPFDLSGPPGANMIYTSGTTGRPKGVKRARAASLEKAFAGFEAYAHRIGCDGSGPHLVTGPLYHAAPLMFAIYDQQNGAPVLLMPRWDDERCLEVLQEREVHHTHLVPTMFVRLLRLPDATRRAFSAPALHTVLHGAAPIAPATKRAMIEWWGPLLVEYWGGTEGGVNTLLDSQQWLEHPGSVGRCLPGFEVFAVGDDGERLPVDEIGTLYCRNENVPHCFAYHGAPEKTSEAFLDDHTFTLGDMGFVDRDGFVHLADRRSNMIISGGVNIYPAEIEAVLIQHPAVADVGVFGIPDDEWGEQVKAAVQLTPGHAPDAGTSKRILAYAREHLAGYKVPRSIDFEVDLPRDTTGKLYVRRLRDRYWGDRKI